MANYVFKQFCADLDESSLDQLLDIVAKPVDDGDLLEDDDSSDDDDDSDSAAEEVEIDDGGDDDSDDQ